MILGGDALGRVALGQITTGAAVVVVPGEDSWHQPFNTDMVRRLPPYHASRQQFAAYVEAQPFKEDIKVTDWFQPFSEPTRFRPALPTRLQQFAALTLFEIKADTWFVPFDEPTRLRPRLQTSLQQFSSYVEIPPFYETVSADRWFVPFSEPTRFRPRLATALQQFRAAPEFALTTGVVQIRATLLGVATISGVPTGNYKQILATDNKRKLIFAAEISPWTLTS